jgi:hypothetical protein
MRPGIALADMIETLRQELQLKVAVGTKGKAEAGIAFWVVKAGAAVEGSLDTVHTFKLTLSPVTRSSGGRTRISAKVPAGSTPGSR